MAATKGRGLGRAAGIGRGSGRIGCTDIHVHRLYGGERRSRGITVHEIEVRPG
jgi:hypothetical protein